MNKPLAMTALVMLLVGGNRAQAEFAWRFESPSLWACMIECSGEESSDAIGTCLQHCGADYESAPSARGAAAELQCRAALLRAEARQFTCQSRCLAGSSANELGPCVERCSHRYEMRSALILGTSRCAGMSDNF